jgi:hypothetical protein
MCNLGVGWYFYHGCVPPFKTGLNPKPNLGNLQYQPTNLLAALQKTFHKFLQYANVDS